MTSLLFSSLLLLLARDALAVPAPAVTPPPGQAAAEADLANEFAAEKSGLEAYSTLAIQTSLSPQELAEESSILNYYATASFSDIPYETNIPTSLLAAITGPSGVS
ncbi:MAG: hypothetical protein L6R39_001795, partial [Caloplaca ligustica]